MEFVSQFEAETVDSRTDKACKARFLVFRTAKRIIVLMVYMTLEDNEVERGEIQIIEKDDINTNPLFETNGILQCQQYKMHYVAIAFKVVDFEGFEGITNLQKDCVLCAFDEMTFAGITPKPREERRLPFELVPLDREILLRLQFLSGIPTMLFTGRYCLNIETDGTFEKTPGICQSYHLYAPTRATFDYPHDRVEYRRWMILKTALRNEILAEAELEWTLSLL